MEADWDLDAAYRSRCTHENIRTAWRLKDKQRKTELINNIYCEFPYDVIFDMNIEELADYARARDPEQDSRHLDYIDHMVVVYAVLDLKRGINSYDVLSTIIMSDAGAYVLDYVENSPDIVDLVQNAAEFVDINRVSDYVQFLFAVLTRGDKTYDILLDYMRNVRTGMVSVISTMYQWLTEDQIQQLYELRDMEVINALPIGEYSGGLQVEDMLQAIADIGDIDWYMQVLSVHEPKRRVINVTHFIDNEKIIELLDMSPYNYIAPDVLQRSSRDVVDAVVRQSSYVWDPRYMTSLDLDFYCNLHEIVYFPAIFMDDGYSVDMPRVHDMINDTIRAIARSYVEQDDRKSLRDLAALFSRLGYINIPRYMIAQ